MRNFLHRYYQQLEIHVPASSQQKYYGKINRASDNQVDVQAEIRLDNFHKTKPFIASLYITSSSVEIFFNQDIVQDLEALYACLGLGAESPSQECFHISHILQSGNLFRSRRDAKIYNSGSRCSQAA
jgi:hypothetical protein